MAEKEKTFKDFQSMGEAMQKKARLRHGEYGPLAEAFHKNKEPYIGWPWDLLKEKLGEDFKHKKILDLGCGSGLSTEGLRLEGFEEVVGADPDENMLAIAKREFPHIPFYKASASDLSEFKDESFDAITIYWAFQNFGNDPDAIKEIRRVLKPGGICMIITGAIEGFAREGRKIIGKYVTETPTVLPSFASSGSSSVDLLREKYGFTSVATYENVNKKTYTADEAFHSFDAASGRNFVPPEKVQELNAELKAWCEKLAKEEKNRSGKEVVYRDLRMIADIAVK